MPHYAIGDVQGCYQSLMRLLEYIDYDSQADYLWFTGDLVNRGPDSLAVLEFVRSLGNKAITVLGNHDLHLLAVAYGIAPIKPQDTFQALLSAEDHLDWLRHQKFIHYDQSFNLVLVHAGIAPEWRLAAALTYGQEVEQALQGKDFRLFLRHMYGDYPDHWSTTLTGWPRLRLITNYFTRMRYCNAHGRLLLDYKQDIAHAPAGYIPWFDVNTRQNTDLPIIFGHWAALRGQTTQNNLYPLDTGCVWGGQLTAMRLEDKQRFAI